MTYKKLRGTDKEYTQRSCFDCRYYMQEHVRQYCQFGPIKQFSYCIRYEQTVRPDQGETCPMLSPRADQRITIN